MDTRISFFTKARDSRKGHETAGAGKGKGIQGKVAYRDGGARKD